MNVMTTELKPCDKRRILVVEDEKSVREIYFQVLSGSLPECRVDLAVNGEEGVEAFREAFHGILIMDLRMPIMDGETAFHEIEKLCSEENIEMPSVIFCTGFIASDSVQHIIDDNPKHCLMTKPFDTDLLLKELSARMK
jgi:two-component system response regulator AtoC